MNHSILNHSIRHIFGSKKKLPETVGKAATSDNEVESFEISMKEMVEDEGRMTDSFPVTENIMNQMASFQELPGEPESLESETVVKPASFSKPRKTRRGMRAELAEELEIARLNASQELLITSSEDPGLEINKSEERLERKRSISQERRKRSSSREIGRMNSESCKDALRQVRERSRERRPRRGSKELTLTSLLETLNSHHEPSMEAFGEQGRLKDVSTTKVPGVSGNSIKAPEETQPGECGETDSKTMMEKRTLSSSRHRSGGLATSLHSVSTIQASLEESVDFLRRATRNDSSSDLKRSSVHSGSGTRTRKSPDTGRRRKGSSTGDERVHRRTSSDRRRTRREDNGTSAILNKADSSETKLLIDDSGSSSESPVQTTLAWPTEVRVASRRRVRRAGQTDLLASGSHSNSGERSSSRNLKSRERCKPQAKDSSCDARVSEEATGEKAKSRSLRRRDSPGLLSGGGQHCVGSHNRKKRCTTSRNAHQDGTGSDSTEGLKSECSSVTSINEVRPTNLGWSEGAKDGVAETMSDKEEHDMQKADQVVNTTYDSPKQKFGSSKKEESRSYTNDGLPSGGAVELLKFLNSSYDNLVEKDNSYMVRDAFALLDRNRSESSLDFFKSVTRNEVDKSVDTNLERLTKDAGSFDHFVGDDGETMSSTSCTSPAANCGTDKQLSLLVTGRRPNQIKLTEKAPSKSTACLPPPSFIGDTTMDVKTVNKLSRENPTRGVGCSKSDEGVKLVQALKEDGEGLKRSLSFRHSILSRLDIEEDAPRHSSNRKPVRRVSRFVACDDENEDDDDSTEIVVNAVNNAKKMDKREVFLKARLTASLCGKGTKKVSNKVASSSRHLLK